MKSNRLFFFAIALLLLMGCQNELKVVHFQYLISNGRLGSISVGEPVDTVFMRLKGVFTVVKDSLPSCEGCDEYTPLYRVQDDNTTGYLFDFEPGWEGDKRDEVIRITTRSSKFLTDKGIGVGMSVGEIREKYEIQFIDAGGEVGIHIFLKDFRGSFGIELPEIENWWDYDKETLPDSLRVIEIIII